MTVPCILPETAIGFSLNLLSKLNELFTRSGSASKQEMRKILLNFNAAHVRYQFQPGLLNFITRWCIRYHIYIGGKRRKATVIT